MGMSQKIPRKTRCAQDDFVLLLPEMKRLLRWCFRMENADQREEHVQDAICRAWATGWACKPTPRAVPP